MSKESDYNHSLTVNDLTRQESLDPKQWKLLTYIGPKSTCEGIPSGKLANMAGGFHFNLFDVKWYASEHLYLCGEWSTADERNIDIQRYIIKQKSGVYAKRCSKAKYKACIREDWPSIRYSYMLWTVWQKCTLNSNFAQLLRSIPQDVVIVEVIKKDPVWATHYDETGNLVGGNAMGKILTICKRCLETNTEPEYDKDLLNKAGIYILGTRLQF